MNWFLTVLLLLLIAWVAYRAYSMERHWTQRHELDSDPQNLRIVLEKMLGTVRRQSAWDQIELMRAEVRRALGELDRLRHKVGRTRSSRA